MTVVVVFCCINIDKESLQKNTYIDVSIIEFSVERAEKIILNSTFCPFSADAVGEQQHQMQQNKARSIKRNFAVFVKKSQHQHQQQQPVDNCP